jgi:hypothetical protein
MTIEDRVRGFIDVRLAWRPTTGNWPTTSNWSGPG